MQGYLVFSLDGARYVIKNITKFPDYKKIIFLTDRIIVNNILKENGLTAHLIQEVLTQKKFNNDFIKNYEIFNNSLKKLDTQSNDKINIFYNSFRHVGSRNYAGIILILDSLNILTKKFKIKKFFLHYKIGNSIFEPRVYYEIFEYFCKSRKIEFEIDNSRLSKSTQLIENIFKSFFFIKNKLINNFDLDLLKVKIKKIITYMEFLKKEDSILIIEPAVDLMFMNYKIRNTYFKKIEHHKNFYSSFKNRKKSNIYNYNPYLKIIIYNLKNNLIFNKKLILDESRKILNFIKVKKIKKLFWGNSPTPFFANILDVLQSKNIKIFGTQHGGKYFIQNDDIYHKDLDYSFCSRFLAYGVSKYFNKKKFLQNKTKILDVGCLSSDYVKNKYKDLNLENLKDNILYVPVTSGKFLISPVVGTMDFEHNRKQIEICQELNKTKFYKKFIKLHNTDLTHAPLKHNLKNYRNFSIYSCTLIRAINIVKPKIIVCDSLSTPIYDFIYTPAEIIIFLDNNNLPKKDVLLLLSKRVFFVKDIKEMKSVISRIKNKNATNYKNNEFLQKFYSIKSHNLIN